MTWKHVPYLLVLCEGNPCSSVDSPSQRASNAELWWFLCCYWASCKTNDGVVSDLRCQNVVWRHCIIFCVHGTVIFFFRWYHKGYLIAGEDLINWSPVTACGLLPNQRQAITWNQCRHIVNWTPGINFSEIWIIVLIHSFKKNQLELLSATW